MTQPTAKIDPSLIIAIAQSIANCDFRTTVQMYVTGRTGPWIITVGEMKWQRHMVVEQVNDDGSDATLAVLGPDQSTKFGCDISLRDVTVRVQLKDLIRNKYTSVKNYLQPQAVAV